MKMNSTLLAITAGLAGISLHAAPVPSPTTPEAALTAREYRTNLLRDELSARDTRIEGRIDLIIDALRATGDSKDSGGKVARMKEQTIAALNKTIAYYQTKRAALQEEMSQPSLRLTDEQKRKGADIFDARIEKRIAQVFVVQRSLPGHTDFERYRVGLRDSIARIEQHSGELKMQNAPPEEIAKNKALVAARRRQLAASLAPTGGATQNVGESVARDLDRALQTEIAELRKEFTTLFARYSVYLQELSALNQSRTALKPQTE